MSASTFSLRLLLPTTIHISIVIDFFEVFESPQLFILLKRVPDDDDVILTGVFLHSYHESF